MYFLCMRVPKFALRSERAFEEIAHAWPVRLSYEKRCHFTSWVVVGTVRVDPLHLYSVVGPRRGGNLIQGSASRPPPPSLPPPASPSNP